MNKISSGVTAAKGYLAAGITTNIKESGKKDLALIYSEKKAVAAAMFTTNKFKAAPVLLSQKRMKNNEIQAVIINSGNANAGTGKQGYKDAEAMTELTAEKLNIKPELVQVASTGIIGKNLPLQSIKTGINKIAERINKNGNKDAAEAILTTDTVKKEIAYEFKLPSDGTTVKLGGMAKGSGMIHPNMATMLAFITTDAVIEKSIIKQALNDAVQISFNKISVDGDQSTNDSVYLMANGMAGNKIIKEKNKDYAKFVEVLKNVCIYLAKAIVADGEGVTRFITLKIEGAADKADAEKAARSIANSNLVKTACFGGDPNWGRIIAAIGSTDVDFEIGQVVVTINNEILFKQGQPTNIDQDKLNSLLDGDKINIKVNLGKGSSQLLFWTSDLSYEYIKINAEYHT
ncbi:MAG: bifunctional glutamate N-acetyltransferase/amino-acid acetyltransferase ArgJ [Halothermotrichaceae bacterium]